MRLIIWMDTVYNFETDVRISHVAAQDIGDEVTLRTTKDGIDWALFTCSAKYDKGWYACRVDKDGLVTVDKDRCTIIGWTRPTLDALHQLLDTFDASYEVAENYKPVFIASPTSYKDSPTGIKLNSKLRWQERMRGVVFKNHDTKVEYRFPGNMTEVQEKIDVPYYSLNMMLFNGKVVKGWYIERIEPNAPPIIRRATVNNDYRFMVKGGTSIPVELPIRTIVNITMITKTDVNKLLKGIVKKCEGWTMV